jgi:hypothetical protein
MTAAKKNAGKKPAPKSPNQPLPEGMLGTREIAAKLNIEPRYLRVVLRSLGKGTGGERYQWKENDPFIAKLPTLIAEDKSKANGAAKGKTA